VKFVPAALSLIVTAFLAAVLIMPEKLDLLARLSSKDTKEFSHYESLFLETKITDTDGNTIDFKRIDAPVVIVNFWAAWCRPCLEEFPSLVELRNTFSPAELFIVGINADEENQNRHIDKITEEYKLNFPNVADKNSELINSYMISALPVSIVFKNGKVEQISKGRKDFMAEEFVQLVRQAQTKLVAKPHVN
jgi:peroxiredoxin